MSKHSKIWLNYFFQNGHARVVVGGAVSAENNPEQASRLQPINTIDVLQIKKELKPKTLSELPS